MAKYIIVESRSPFESVDAQHTPELLDGLRAQGNEVVLFLVQNGVLPARKGARYGDRLSQLAQNQVKVFADRFSLTERAIETVVPGVEASDLERLVQLLVEPGVKALWH